MLAKGSVRSLLSGVCGHLDLLVGRPGRLCPVQRLLWGQGLWEVSQLWVAVLCCILVYHTWCPALPHRSRTGVADIEWEAGSTWGPLRRGRKPRACLCSPRCPRDALSPQQRLRTLRGRYAPLDETFCLSQTLEGLFCPDVQESQPRVKGEQESHLGSVDMKHVPDHREWGQEAGTLT